MAKPVITVVCLLAVLTTARADFLIGNVPVAVMGIAAAVNPVTNRVYVANFNSNNVTVIDGATDGVVATVAVGTSPMSLAASQGTQYLTLDNSSGVW